MDDRLPKLLSRIAHDLRGPGGVALGALDELASHPDAMQTLLPLARRGVLRTIRIAERLSMAAQWVSGPPRLDIQTCDIAALARTAAEEINRIQGRKAVAFTITMDTTAKVPGDPAWLRVALAERVADALRFAKSSVAVRGYDEGARAVIVVERDGAAAPEGEPDPYQYEYGHALPFAFSEIVIRAHGGESAVDEGGLRIVMKLPTA